MLTRLIKAAYIPGKNKERNISRCWTFCNQWLHSALTYEMLRLHCVRLIDSLIKSRFFDPLPYYCLRVTSVQPLGNKLCVTSSDDQYYKAAFSMLYFIWPICYVVLRRPWRLLDYQIIMYYMFVCLFVWEFLSNLIYTYINININNWM